MEGVGSGAGGVGAGATAIGDGVGAAAALAADEFGRPGPSSTDAFCARQTTVNPRKHTRPKTITLDAVLHSLFMGDLLPFCPSVRACYIVLKCFNPIDQRDDITVMINSSQTNTFSPRNKNCLAKDNLWWR
jgi:hypothetical protein